MSSRKWVYCILPHITTSYSLPTLNEYTKLGWLNSYKLGKRVLYKTEEVLACVDRVATHKHKRGSDQVAIKVLKAFLNNAKKRFADFEYLWVAERQTKNETFKDNIHFHLITNKFWKIDK